MDATEGDSESSFGFAGGGGRCEGNVLVHLFAAGECLLVLQHVLELGVERVLCTLGASGAGGIDFDVATALGGWVG